MTAPSTQDMGASLQSPTGVEFWLTLTDPAGAHYWYYYCCTRPRSTRCSIASQPPPLLLAVASTARPANVGGSLGRRPSKLPVNAHGHFHRDFLPGGSACRPLLQGQRCSPTNGMNHHLPSGQGLLLEAGRGP
ncbi:hypothetical protein SNOG_02469 [Parastagonospora nodorum SN15]|uniref:Uncharacterized protein n=1 Tax=Phaeosphaeria nodorum (strain SN15 / ATCC MYA-4574 / FGSC 10173) TaxID=321614 RepID=Q0V0J5_PHANO|nr:hypothetical protein SNOG_02469 [Parastagonospora nodorum SN15]EAT90681.1 hypothetical protein SNOG_02469 [Parastagonospora nodorum SN15]